MCGPEHRRIPQWTSTAKRECWSGALCPPPAKKLSTRRGAASLIFKNFKNRYFAHSFSFTYFLDYGFFRLWIFLDYRFSTKLYSHSLFFLPSFFYPLHINIGITSRDNRLCRSSFGENTGRIGLRLLFQKQ